MPWSKDHRGMFKCTTRPFQEESRLSTGVCALPRIFFCERVPCGLFGHFCGFLARGHSGPDLPDISLFAHGACYHVCWRALCRPQATDGFMPPGSLCCVKVLALFRCDSHPHGFKPGRGRPALRPSRLFSTGPLFSCPVSSRLFSSDKEDCCSEGVLLVPQFRIGGAVVFRIPVVLVLITVWARY